MAEVVREWDAANYKRISLPHEEWAKVLVKRLALDGAETVLDAGCGTGRVTRMLVEHLPDGRVIGVDGSKAMIEKVREVLRPQDEALVSDLTELRLQAPVDAVISSAVFHWIVDHDRLFATLRANMKDGARLVAQCGGAGNIDAFRRDSMGVAAREPYAEHLATFVEPWNYASAEETEERLRRAGFAEVRCWLQPWEVLPPEPTQYMRTVMLAPHLDSLPAELHDAFIADVLAEIGEPPRLDYVRLNIEALAA
jgi:trans-aconitate 2-methyltransferase